MKRGYFGIGICEPKTEANYEMLFRSAHWLDASFLFLINQRFKATHHDTTRAEKHMPLYEHETVEGFLKSRPLDCKLISIEITPNAVSLVNFVHPERAIYVLGREDGSIPQDIIEQSSSVVKIPSTRCLNVSVAGSIVMYDRIAKEMRRATRVLSKEEQFYAWETAKHYSEKEKA